MPSEARQKKIMEKLNRAQKCSILGPQNLGSGGARAPGAPPGSAPELCRLSNFSSTFRTSGSMFKAKCSKRRKTLVSHFLIFYQNSYIIASFIEVV